MLHSILIADDEKIVNDLLKLFLEQAGFEVFSAYTGKEALDIIRKEKPSLIVLDIGLPDMTGIEVIQELRNIVHNTIVFVMTGFKDDELERKAEELGVVRFISKPFAANNLVEEIKTTLKDTATP